MFGKHLFKVILSFCGMIILGLATLVVIDSFKDDKQKEVSPTANTVSTSKTQR